MNTLILAIAALAAPQIPVESSGEKRSPEIRVEIEAEAAIRGTQIELGDLASVKTADPELDERLLHLDLGNPPQPGYVRTITRNDVLLRLMREGFPVARIRIGGAEKSYLQPVSHNLTADELEREAMSILDRTILGEEHGDVTYKLRSRLSMQRVPVGRESRELRSRIRDGKLGSNTVQVDIDVIIDGATFKTIPLYFGLTRSYRVLAIVSDVAKGAELNEENVGWQDIEIQFRPENYITDFEQLRGQVASKRLRRGDVLSVSHLEPRALFRSGDVIQLAIGGGMIKVKTRVRALEDGHYGKFIRVQRLGALGNTTQNNRRREQLPILIAKVLSPTTVSISTDFDN